MGRKLNPKQERFCQLYTSSGEFFGNGVQSYIEAYKPKQNKRNWYSIAKQSASQLLTNINLCRHINDLLEADGFNNEFVDKQTLFLITQHVDFNAKIRAIQEYNKLKKRITDKLDMNIKTDKPVDLKKQIYEAIHKINGNKRRE